MARFTIITPTLNRRAMLEQAIASLRAQKGADIEHIVVDGGSRDGTQEMLAKIGGMTTITDRGRGLYDAINQGIAQATGDFIGILNSDDLYAPGALAAVAKALEETPTADAACGAAELFDDLGGKIRRFDDPLTLGLDAYSALIGPCITNARFFRRQIFAWLGTFSSDYPRVADREFLSRVLIADIRTVIVPTLVYRYRRHAGSLTLASSANQTEDFREELLRLARAVSIWPAAGPDLKAAARMLEGRCLGMLAFLRLRRGALGQAARTLAVPSRGSTVPLAAIAYAAFKIMTTGR